MILFTEFEKIKRRSNTDVANPAYLFAKFSLVIGENALKIEKKKLTPVKDFSALVGPITPILVL